MVCIGLCHCSFRFWFLSEGHFETRLQLSKNTKNYLANVPISEKHIEFLNYDDCNMQTKCQLMKNENHYWDFENLGDWIDPEVVAKHIYGTAGRFVLILLAFVIVCWSCLVIFALVAFPMNMYHYLLNGIICITLAIDLCLIFWNWLI